MTKASCSMDGCDVPSRVRGMCRSHYGRAYRHGEVVPLPARELTLSEVDEEARTATCAVHGVGVRVRASPRKDGTNHYACARCVRGTAPRKRKLWKVSPADYRRYKYGLSEAEYEIMKQAQGARCLICQTQPDDLVVDHDHVTGLVRGLLCPRCNFALGWMYDNPVSLERAARYLRRHVA